jgi:hypothetical protein
MNETPYKPRSSRSQEDLNRLIELASQQPGLAEVFALHDEYQARLTELQAALGQQCMVSFSTSDSTAETRADIG